VNLLSVGASFGLLTLVFQHGFAASLIGVHQPVAIVAWIPIFLFAVLFGLSMDYHVFVLTRIREAAPQGLPTAEAVRRGVTRSAGVVTSAAVVMMSVFAVFATLDLVEFKQMGVGLTAAVFLDAVIVRIVVLPALMTLLGRANWWPSRLARRPARPDPDDAVASQRPGVLTRV
jgi:RND superfamily putative drug exporter